jgi:hypothetical protein
MQMRRRGAPLLRGALLPRATTAYPQTSYDMHYDQPRADTTVTAAPCTTVRPVPPGLGQPATSVVPDVVAQLSCLVELAEQGVLSDTEFAVAKARLLAARRLPWEPVGSGGWAVVADAAAHPPG